MRLRIRVGDPARHLSRVHGGIAHDGKHGDGIEVTALLGQLREVDAAPIDARRRAGFQSPLRQLQLFQTRGQRQGRGIARAAS
jgi:hypothetical protein